MTLLKTSHLSVTYGGVRALVDLSLHVSEGAVVGLIGTNGAGKTTALDAITGFTEASGEAYLGDSSLLGLPAHARARLGLARTWQAGQLFEDMTVMENLRVSLSANRDLRHLSRLRRGRNVALDDQVSTTIELLGLEKLLGATAGDLSQGQRKLLGLARALMTSPKVLLADEPAAGLDSDESSSLAAYFKRLAAEGLAILLVEHDMELILNSCDHIYVLDQGRLISEGTPAQIQSDNRVLAAYLGAPPESLQADVP